MLLIKENFYDRKLCVICKVTDIRVWYNISFKKRVLSLFMLGKSKVGKTSNWTYSKRFTKNSKSNET